MQQAEIDRAVARATGESVTTIKRLGFLLADGLDTSSDEDPYVIDWDALEAQRFDARDKEPCHEPAGA